MNHRIGYAGVSTDDQHLDLQSDELTRAGCSAIYGEAASGESEARPELEQCRKSQWAGDTLSSGGWIDLAAIFPTWCRSWPMLLDVMACLEQPCISMWVSSLPGKVDTGCLQWKPARHSWRNEYL